MAGNNRKRKENPEEDYSSNIILEDLLQWDLSTLCDGITSLVYNSYIIKQLRTYGTTMEGATKTKIVLDNVPVVLKEALSFLPKRRNEAYSQFGREVFWSDYLSKAISNRIAYVIENKVKEAMVELRKIYYTELQKIDIILLFTSSTNKILRNYVLKNGVPYACAVSNPVPEAGDFCITQCWINIDNLRFKPLNRGSKGLHSQIEFTYELCLDGYGIEIEKKIPKRRRKRSNVVEHESEGYNNNNGLLFE